MSRWRKPGMMIALPMALLLMNGCSNFQYERTLTSWKGAPVRELMDSWGPPHEQFRDAQGNMVYQWSYREIGGDSSNASFQYKSGRQKRSPFCHTRFTADRNDMIQKWAYRGSDCSGTPRS